MGPEEAVEAFRDSAPPPRCRCTSERFPTGTTRELQPPAVLREVLAAAPDVAPHFAILDNGESLEVPPVGAGSPAPAP